VPDSPADWLTLAPEVAEALKDGRPVVALESTLIAHGLPYPQNLHTAHMLEETVREHGAIPATIAVLDGTPRIGLGEDDLLRLAQPPSSSPRRGEDLAPPPAGEVGWGRLPGREAGRGLAVRKLSRRDLAIAVAQGADGATTVAATMILAAAAGIAVFATGGIGGVHRGQPFDVSADLPELAETRVVVVCAGAKAILDLPLTLEWLETHGVPVLGYGTDEFPAFYARSSGLPVDARVDSPAEVAAIVRAKRRMGLRGGVLVAVPPPEETAMAPSVVETAIHAALADAEAQGIRGKEITPFLLARIAELTAGASLAANIALLRNNAAVAAQIAATLARNQGS
jgi:pseudouridine-5'-phosphate glycosidase